MPLDGFPIVRLTVENMRHQVLAALGPHFDGLKAATEHAVEAVVRDFDVNGAVAADARRAIQDQIRRTVEDVVAEVFRSAEVREAVREAIGNGVRAYFEGEARGR